MVSRGERGRRRGHETNRKRKKKGGTRINTEGGMLKKKKWQH